MYKELIVQNKLYIPESFDTNITHQLFDYKRILVNSQRENTNSKSDTKINMSQKYILKSFNINFISDL